MIGGTHGTAVILTSLGLEYMAVREHLGDGLDEREARGTLYEVGTFTGRHDTWTVAIAELGAGTTAGIQLERAVQAFSPEVVLFVGVAAGFKGLELGDVVAADAVYDYDAGRDTESRYHPRIKTAASSYRLVQCARTVATKRRWQQRIKPAPPQPPPTALVKPIAAGSKVVSHDRSQTAQLLARFYGDAVAVDMESHGFLHGAYVNEGVGALVVRGIYDLLTDKDEHSDREWQPAAARNAAAFAFELLNELAPKPGAPSRTHVRVSAAASDARAVQADHGGPPGRSLGPIRQPDVTKPMAVGRELRVFLCHSSSDKPRVRVLGADLRAEGIRTWLDDEDLLPGQDWDFEISKAIRSCDVVLVCLSKDSINKRGYVHKEIKRALDVASEQPEGAIYLIPVRLEPCEVPERIRRWHWVDLFQEDGYDRLISALQQAASQMKV